MEGQNGIKKRQKGISIRPEVFCKKGVLKKEALVQVFSCEFYKTFKNIYSYRTPSVAAPERVTSQLKALEDNNITTQILYVLTFLFLSLILFFENNSGMKKYPLKGLDN